MDEKYIEDLYNQLGGKDKFGSYESFSNLISSDDSYIKDFHNAFGEQTLGSFDSFSKLVKKKDESDSISPEEVMGGNIQVMGEDGSLEPSVQEDEAVAETPAIVEEVAAPVEEVVAEEINPATAQFNFDEYTEESVEPTVTEGVMYDPKEEGMQFDTTITYPESSTTFERSLSYITPQLIRREEEEVVNRMDYLFGDDVDGGFEFEETDAGDAMIVTASNGETHYVNLDKFGQILNEEGDEYLNSILESERPNIIKFQEFLRNNRKPFEGDEVSYKEDLENIKYFSRKAVDLDVATVKSESNDLTQRFLDYKKTLSNVQFQIDDLSQKSSLNPEQLALYNSLLSQKKELSNEKNSIADKYENLIKSNAQIERNVGEYLSMKLDDGNAVSTLAKGFMNGLITKGITGPTASLVGGVMDVFYGVAQSIDEDFGMTEDEKKERYVTIAKDLGYDIPDNIEDDTVYNSWIEGLNNPEMEEGSTYSREINDLLIADGYDPTRTLVATGSGGGRMMWKKDGGLLGNGDYEQQPDYAFDKTKGERLKRLVLDAEVKESKNPTKEYVRHMLDFMASEGVSDERVARNKGESIIQEGLYGLAESLPSIALYALARGKNKPAAEPAKGVLKKIGRSFKNYITNRGAVAQTLGFTLLQTDALMVEMENDPDFKYITETEKKALTLPLAITTAVLERWGLRSIVTNKTLVANLMKTVTSRLAVGASPSAFRTMMNKVVQHNISKGVYRVAGATVMEYETGGLQQVAEIGMKDVWNDMYEKEMFTTPDGEYLEWGSEYLQQVNRAALAEAVGGFVMGTPGAIATAFNKNQFDEISDSMIDLFDEIRNDKVTVEAYKARLDLKVIAKEMTKEEAQKALLDFEVLSSSAETVSGIQGLTKQQTKEALGLTYLKNQLEHLLSKTDPNVGNNYELIEAQLNDVTSKLKNIGTSRVITQEEEELVEDIKSEEDILDTQDLTQEDRTAREENLTKLKQELSAVQEAAPSQTETEQNAIQEPSTEEVDVQEPSLDSGEMGEGDTTVQPSITGETQEEGESESDIAQTAEEEVSLDERAEQIDELIKKENEDSAPKEPQPIPEEQIEVVDETISINKPKAPPVRNNPLRESVIRRAKNVSKSLKKVFPNVKIILHETSEAFVDATGRLGRGEYIGNTIHVNLELADGTTVGHEAFHVIIVNKLLTDTAAQEVTKRMLKSLLKTLRNNDPLAIEIRNFMKGYDQKIQTEEGVAQMLGILSSRYKLLAPKQKTIIGKWIDIIKKLLGKEVDIITESDQQVVDLLNTLISKLTSGIEIESSDLSVIDKIKEDVDNTPAVEAEVEAEVETTQRQQRTIQQVARMYNMTENGYFPKNVDTFSLKKAVANAEGNYSIRKAKSGSFFLSGSRGIVKDLFKRPQPTQRQQRTGSVYFSNALKAIDNIKDTNPKQPIQWVRALSDTQKNGGVGGVNQELSWIGLEDYLNKWQKENKAKSISKDVVEQYINDNQIEIVEVGKGGSNLLTQKDIKEVRLIEGSENNYEVEYKDGFIDKIYNATDKEDASYNSIAESNRSIEEDTEDTKYSDYQLEGGENYQEVLLTLPNNKGQKYADKMRSKYGENLNPVEIYEKMSEQEKETQAKLNNESEVSYKSSHWDESNILAHVRLNERTLPNGEKVLFIEEIQSDWAQDGKKKGFVSNLFRGNFRKFVEKEKGLRLNQEELLAEYSNNQGELKQEFLERTDRSKTPDMPYKKTDQWVGLAIRRVMKMASDKGFDRIAWVTGEQSADRYDLSKQIDSISWDTTDLTFTAFDKNGNQVIQDSNVSEDKLESYVGKEVTQRLVESKENLTEEDEGVVELQNQDLKVGGEGMKTFYNSILPKVAKKEAQRFDKKAKIEVVDFNSDLKKQEARLIELNDQIKKENNPKKKASLLTERIALLNERGLKKINVNKPSNQLSIALTPKMNQELEGGIGVQRQQKVGGILSKNIDVTDDSNRKGLVPVEQLKDFIGEDRVGYAEMTTSRETIDKLKEDIKENGFKQPILVVYDKFSDKGEASIIEGNHRIQAAIELGLKEVPVKFEKGTLRTNEQREADGMFPLNRKTVGEIDTRFGVDGTKLGLEVRQPTETDIVTKSAQKPTQRQQRTIQQVARMYNMTENGYFPKNVDTFSLKKAVANAEGNYSIRKAKSGSFFLSGSRGIVKDLFKRPQSRQRQQIVFNKSETPASMIKKARELKYNNPEIKEILKENTDLSAPEINELLKVPVNLFKNLPESFINVKGGVKKGLATFRDINNFIKTLNERNEKLETPLTQEQLSTKAIEKLQSTEAYKNAADFTKVKGEMKASSTPSTQQIQMEVAVRESFDVKPTKDAAKTLRNLKSKIKERLKGIKDIQKIKRELRNFIRQSLPNDQYTKANVLKMVRFVANLTVTELTGPQLKTTMDKIQNFVTEKNIATLKSKLETLLDTKNYTKLENSILKGKKVSADVKTRIDKIRESIPLPSTTSIEIQSQMAAWTEEINTLSGKMVQTNADLSRMSDLEIMIKLSNSVLMDGADLPSIHQVSVLDSASTAIESLIKEGKSSLREELAANRAKAKKEMQDLYNDMTGENVNLTPEKFSVDDAKEALSNDGITDPTDIEIADKIIELQDENAKEIQSIVDKIQKDFDTEDNRVDTKKNNFILTKAFRAVTTGIDNFLNKNETLQGLMDIISKGPGEMLGGVAQRLFYKKINSSSVSYKARMILLQDQITNKMSEIYGKSWKKDARSDSRPVGTGVYRDAKAVAEAQKKVDENPTRKNRKNLEQVIEEQEIIMSPNEIYYQYNQFQDPANKKSYANKKNRQFGNDPDRIMQELYDTLSDENKEWARWQREEFFPEVYEHYNEVYKKIYRTDMPWNEFYAGRIYRTGKEGKGFENVDVLNLRGSETQFGTSVGSSSTKSRVDSDTPIAYMDGNDALMSYITDMEWFAAYAENVRDISKLMNNTDIKKTIEIKHGSDMNELIDTQINRIATRGINTSDGNKVVNLFNNIFITSRLGLNPTVMLKQLTSMPTYANSIGPINYAKYAVKNKAEMLKVYKEIRDNSVYMKDRGIQDMKKVIESYSTKQTTSFLPQGLKSKFGYFSEFMMVTTKLGDRAAIFLGGMPNYSYYKAEFKKKKPNATEQQAIDYAIRKFELDTKSTQQSMDLQDKDYFQAGGPIARAFNMFMTTPKQYFRMERMAFRQLWRKTKAFDRKAGKGTLGQNLRTLAMYHVVMPALFQYVTLGLPGMLRKGTDEDEKDMMRAAILGNLNSLYLVGDLLTMVFDKFRGKPWAETAPSLPVFEMTAELMRLGERAQTTIDPEKKAEYTTKFITKFMDLSSLPASNMYKLYKNYEKLVDGKVDNPGEAFLRAFNYSDYVIEGQVVQPTQADMDQLEEDNPQLWKKVYPGWLLNNPKKSKGNKKSSKTKKSKKSKK